MLPLTTLHVLAY